MYVNIRSESVYKLLFFKYLIISFCTYLLFSRNGFYEFEIKTSTKSKTIETSSVFTNAEFYLLKILYCKYIPAYKSRKYWEMFTSILKSFFLNA